MRALRKRVASWKRVSVEDFAARQNRHWATEKRDSLICGLYMQLYHQIDGEPPFIIGADIPVDAGPRDASLSRHERAIAATAHVLRTRLAIEPPGPRRRTLKRISSPVCTTTDPSVTIVKAVSSLLYFHCAFARFAAEANLDS